MRGECAVVHPVRTGDGGPAVLKLEWPHAEAEHEHLALRHWGGNGAVRLLRADPNRFAFLLERAEARHDLNTLPDLEACEVAARLYPLLHVPAPPHLRVLSEQATRWSRELLALPVGAPLPRRYVERAATLAGDLAADPQCDGTLIHNDLHYDNVLRSARGAGVEWLAIDPKPLSGDAHFEVAPLLWNRWDELVATGDLRTAIRARFHTVVDTAGLDEHRAAAWVVVRQLVNAMWLLTGKAAPGPHVPELDVQVTRCVTVTKAVQA